MKITEDQLQPSANTLYAYSEAHHSNIVYCFDNFENLKKFDFFSTHPKINPGCLIKSIYVKIKKDNHIIFAHEIFKMDYAEFFRISHSWRCPVYKPKGLPFVYCMEPPIGGVPQFLSFFPEGETHENLEYIAVVKNE